MEKAISPSFEMEPAMENRFYVKSETVINMLGVILFYVVVFVAVNVFSG